MYDYSEQANDTLVFTDLTNITLTNFEIRPEISNNKYSPNFGHKLPISLPQVNPPAEVDFDDLIVANPSKRMCLQPVSNSTFTHLPERTTKKELNTDTGGLKLPITLPQVIEPVGVQVDDLILANLNMNICFQPASEFDNFNCFSTEVDMSLYD